MNLKNNLTHNINLFSVALKTLIINENIETMPNEIEILKKLSQQIYNKHIIECLDWFIEKNEIVLVFELCQVGIKSEFL